MPDEPAGTLPEGAAMPKVLRSKTRAVRVVKDYQAANLEVFRHIKICTIDNILIHMTVSNMTLRHGKTGIVIIFVIASLLSCSPIFVTNEDSSIVHKDNHRTVHSDDSNIHDHIDTRYSNTFIEDFDDFGNISAGNTTSVVKTDIGRVEMWGSPITNGDFEDGDLTGWNIWENRRPTNCEVRSGSPDSPGDYYFYFS